MTVDITPSWEAVIEWWIRRIGGPLASWESREAVFECMRDVAKQLDHAERSAGGIAPPTTAVGLQIKLDVPEADENFRKHAAGPGPVQLEFDFENGGGRREKENRSAP
jgi:hypothetical protein